MHGRNNYPLQKEVSDLDVPLEDGCDDATFLKLLIDSLSKIEKVLTPDFIFYQCGVDILATDSLGKLGLSQQGCMERDRMVFEFAKKLDCTYAQFAITVITEERTSSRPHDTTPFLSSAFWWMRVITIRKMW